jgi:hypothetical protein
MRTRGIRLAGILVMMAAWVTPAAFAGDGGPLFPAGADTGPAASGSQGEALFPKEDGVEPANSASGGPSLFPVSTAPEPAKVAPAKASAEQTDPEPDVEPLFFLRAGASQDLTPLVVRAQADATGYAQPDVELPLANGSFWPNGTYVFAQYVMYRQSVPLRNQLVASRGFLDTDGNVTGTVGQFLGFGFTALETNQVRGPGTWQPGTKLGIGYRFDDGTTVDFSWMYVLNVKYTAVANIQPPLNQLDPLLSNTFLFAPVFNFPLAFSGPPNRVQVNGTVVNGGPFGIWNGATAMSEQFDQRFQEYDLTIRKPIFETECWRTYGQFGPRLVWFWDRYKWFTADLDARGNESPVWAANYTNIDSNRMYGFRLGIGNECYLGHGFSVALDLSASGFLDVVKERTAYSRDDRHVGQERKRSRTDYTLVPSAQGTLNLCWYPYRGFELRLGYDVQGFANTVFARHPIDFDFSAVAPTFDRVFRFIDGLQAGVGINF